MGTRETLGSLPLFSAFRLGRLAGGGMRRAATFPRLCRPWRGAAAGGGTQGASKAGQPHRPRPRSRPWGGVRTPPPPPRLAFSPPRTGGSGALQRPAAVALTQAEAGVAPALPAPRRRAIAHRAARASAPVAPPGVGWGERETGGVKQGKERTGWGGGRPPGWGRGRPPVPRWRRVRAPPPASAAEEAGGGGNVNPAAGGPARPPPASIPTCPPRAGSALSGCGGGGRGRGRRAADGGGFRGAHPPPPNHRQRPPGLGAHARRPNGLASAGAGPTGDWLATQRGRASSGGRYHGAQGAGGASAAPSRPLPRPQWGVPPSSPPRLLSQW